MELVENNYSFIGIFKKDTYGQKTEYSSDSKYKICYILATLKEVSWE